MTNPRPAARSCTIPRELAAKLGPELARALGADDEAAAALGAALGRAGAYECTLVVHRVDDELLGARDLAALRGMAPEAAPAAAKPRGRVTTKATLAKAATKKRAAAKRPARAR